MHHTGDKDEAERLDRRNQGYDGASKAVREIYEAMIKPEETVLAAAVGQDQAKQGTEAGSLSLSMQRLEARRRTAARRSKFSQFLENLRDGLSNTMVSSSRAVVNFL